MQKFQFQSDIPIIAHLYSSTQSLNFSTAALVSMDPRV